MLTAAPSKGTQEKDWFCSLSSAALSSILGIVRKSPKRPRSNNTRDLPSPPQSLYHIQHFIHGSVCLFLPRVLLMICKLAMLLKFTKELTQTHTRTHMAHTHHHQVKSELSHQRRLLFVFWSFDETLPRRFCIPSSICFLIARAANLHIWSGKLVIHRRARTERSQIKWVATLDRRKMMLYSQVESV